MYSSSLPDDAKMNVLDCNVAVETMGRIGGEEGVWAVGQFLKGLLSDAALWQRAEQPRRLAWAGNTLPPLPVWSREDVPPAHI